MSAAGTVLIIDDDERVGTFLSRELTKLGYSCTTACDGQQGLERLRASDFDVVITDLVMPKMSGIELLRAMADAKIAAVPIILSSQREVSKFVEAMKLGAFEYIEKPAGISAIRGALERALEHRRGSHRAGNPTLLTEQWEATFDAWPDMVIVLDRAMRILRCNRAVARRLGTAHSELMGRDGHEALCGECHPARTCPLAQGSKGNSVGPTEFEHSLWGGHFELTAAPLRDRSGQVWGIMHIARDITARIRAEEEERATRAETEQLLASISAVLIGLDGDDRVTRWNAGAERVFGIPADRVMGHPLRQSGIPWTWQPIMDRFAACKQQGRPNRLDDIRYSRCDGKEGFLGLTLYPIMKETGECCGLLVLGADITERKILESQLSQAQKLEAIGQLAAGIAHEINTPTQYVGSNVHFLQDAFATLCRLLEKGQRLLAAAKEGPVPPELIQEVEDLGKEADVQYLLQEIPRAVDDTLEGIRRASRIVQATKEFSHPGVSEKTPLDLNKAIESTITVSRNEWKYVAEMVMNFDTELPLVSCLPGEFNQVILNLVINAAHAIGDVVGDGAKGKGTITVTTRARKGHVEIRISDTGPGIPATIRSRVFDPFFTTKEVGRGTGQGLAIAHDVVVGKHGGTITFETESGKGTVFVVRLPIIPQGGSDEESNPVCR